MLDDVYGICGSRSAAARHAFILGAPTTCGRFDYPRCELLTDTTSRARFLREARIASALDHPNIVVLYEVCETEDEIFLAMQCVETVG